MYDKSGLRYFTEGHRGSSHSRFKTAFAAHTLRTKNLIHSDTYIPRMLIKANNPSASQRITCYLHAVQHTCCLRLVVFYCSTRRSRFIVPVSQLPIMQIKELFREERLNIAPLVESGAINRAPTGYFGYGFSARADGISSRMLGDIVDARTTLRT